MSGRREKAGKARMLIVDDHAFMRASIKAILGRDASLEVVGEAEDGLEALECCRKLRPDLVLMDVSMPRIDGIEAIRMIKAEFPQTSVLILTAHADHRLLKEAVRAGAAGYLLKEGAIGHVLDAVRAVLGGEAPPDPGEAIRQALADLAQEEGPRGKPPGGHAPEAIKVLVKGALSAQETEVLRLMALGKTNRQIARELLVSLSSVKTYVQRIIKKLGVSDRTQASVRALEMGLLAQGG
jgi:DNA-binding NarL/FixJ family response regulator